MLAVARETGFAGTLSEGSTKSSGDTPESSRISQVLRQRGVRRRLGALRGRARRAARLVQGSLQPLRAPRHGNRFRAVRLVVDTGYMQATDGLVAGASPRLRQCAPAASFAHRSRSLHFLARPSSGRIRWASSKISGAAARKRSRSPGLSSMFAISTTPSCATAPCHSTSSSSRSRSTSLPRAPRDEGGNAARHNGPP